MKPIYLEIQAFGAFADKQTIDFQQLTKDRLFLIHGATGAGKTTIFDAICFALYGETTTERKGKEMRSQHVIDSKMATKIRFVFERTSKYYEIERVFTPNRAGDDVNEKEWFAEVYWQPAAQIPEKSALLTSPVTGKEKIKEVVKQLVGFDAQQFKQLVILPQGKFQELLLSKSDKKREILAQLFNAKLYEEITKSLKDKEKELEKTLHKQETELAALLKSIDQANLATLQTSIATEKEKIQTIENQLIGSEKNKNDLALLWQNAQQIKKSFENFEQAQNNLAKHLASAETQQKLNEQIKNAEKAEKLRPLMQQGKELKTKIDELKTKITTLQSAAQTAQTAQEQQRQALAMHPELLQKITKNTLAINELEKIKPVLTNLAEVQTALLKQQNQLTVLEKNVATKTANLQVIQEQIATLNQETTANQLHQWANQLSGLGEQYKNLQATEKLLQKYWELQPKVKDKAAALATQQSQFAEQQKGFWLLKQHWHLGQAAELATLLATDQPCPVCGATHHPAPAQKQAQHVSNEAYKQAQTAYEQAQQLLATAETAYKTLLATLQTQEQNLGDKATISKENFGQELKKLAQNEEQAQQATARLKQIEEKIKQLQEQSKNLQPELVATQQELNEVKQQVAIWREKQATQQAQIPQEIKDLQTLTSKISALEKENTNLQKQLSTETETAKQAENKLVALQTELKKEQELLQTYTNEREQIGEKVRAESILLGFATPIEANSALLEKNVLEQYKTQSQQWETTKIQLQTTFETTQQQIANQNLPDLAATEQQYKAAEQQYKTENQALANSKASLQTLQQVENKLQKATESHLAFKEKALPLLELAKMADGKNSTKQTFQGYVLAVFFDEVLQYANQRLSLLSGGRYELQITDKTLHATHEVGLNLEVLDYFTGKTRMVQHLSGGETFFTSLALALGLADVAAARSGGLHLDAIFIDEGFGTLDPDTLDLAIRTLMDLDANYRMVGIISHVQELKDRIPTKLEVVKGKNGSVLKG